MSQPKEIYFADQAFRKENISTENVSSAGNLFCVSLLHVRDPLGVGPERGKVISRIFDILSCAAMILTYLYMAKIF